MHGNQVKLVIGDADGRNPIGTYIGIMMPFDQSIYQLGLDQKLATRICASLGYGYLSRMLTNAKLSPPEPAETLNAQCHSDQQDGELFDRGIRSITRQHAGATTYFKLRYPAAVLCHKLHGVQRPLSELLAHESPLRWLLACHAADTLSQCAFCELHWVDFNNVVDRATPPRRINVGSSDQQQLQELVTLHRPKQASYAQITSILSVVYGYANQPPIACLALQVPVTYSCDCDHAVDLYLKLRPKFMHAAGLTDFPPLAAINSESAPTMPAISPADATDAKPTTSTPESWAYVDLSKVELAVLARLAPQLHDTFLQPPTKAGDARTAALSKTDTEVSIKLRRKGGLPHKPRTTAKFELVLPQADAERYAKLLSRIGQPVPGVHDSPRPHSQEPSPSYAPVGTQTGRHTERSASPDFIVRIEKNTQVQIRLSAHCCRRCDQHWLLAHGIVPQQPTTTRCPSCSALSIELFASQVSPENDIDQFGWLYYVMSTNGQRFVHTDQAYAVCEIRTPDAPAPCFRFVLAAPLTLKLGSACVRKLLEVAEQHQAQAVIACNNSTTEFLVLYEETGLMQRICRRLLEKRRGWLGAVADAARIYFGHHAKVHTIMSHLFPKLLRSGGTQ